MRLRVRYFLEENNNSTFFFGVLQSDYFFFAQVVIFLIRSIAGANDIVANNSMTGKY